MPKHNLDFKYIDKWGYRDQAFNVDQLKIYYRLETTDVKVIPEVLTKYAYQKKSIGFLIEKEDIWLDLGANIGTFSLFVLTMVYTLSIIESVSLIRAKTAFISL